MYSLIFPKSVGDVDEHPGNLCQTVNLNPVTFSSNLAFPIQPNSFVSPIAPNPLIVGIPSTSTPIIPVVSILPSSIVTPSVISSPCVLNSQKKTTDRRCWVFDCPNAKPRRNNKPKLCCFPRDVIRCREWLEAIGDRELARTSWTTLTTLRYVCMLHFHPKHITASGRPTRNAVPMIFKENRPVLPEQFFRAYEKSIPKSRCVAFDHEYVKDASLMESEKTGNAQQSLLGDQTGSLLAVDNAKVEPNHFMENSLQKSSVRAQTSSLHSVDGVTTEPNDLMESCQEKSLLTAQGTYDNYFEKSTLERDKKGDCNSSGGDFSHQRVMKNVSEKSKHQWESSISGSLYSPSLEMQALDKTHQSGNYETESSMILVSIKPPVAKTHDVPVLPVEKYLPLKIHKNVGDLLESPSMTVKKSAKTQDALLSPIVTTFLPFENSQGSMPNNHPLEDLKKEMCRLCGQKKPVMIPIFDTTDQRGEVSVSVKMEMYLPYEIKEDDPLPKHICAECNEKLNRCHELYLTCVAAELVLWKTFGKECEAPSWKLPDSTASREQEEIEQSDTHVSSSYHSGSDLETASVQSFNEIESFGIVGKNKEKQEFVCSVCGLNTVPRGSQENDIFKKEFENVFKRIPSFIYRCCYCHEYFKNRQERKQHRENCNELPTICEICGKYLPHRKYCLKHWRNNHSAFRFAKRKVSTQMCDKCGKFFATGRGYRVHSKFAHEEDQNPKYCCEFCCITFVHESYYNEHRKKHEMGKINSVFKIKELDKHELVKIYHCPVCEQNFCDKLSFIVHLTSKKIMKCPFCRKKFANEKWFLLHKCNQWTCQYCSETFTEKVKLIDHERVHRGERPFKCEICEKKFRTKVGRKKHLETHRSYTFDCIYCGKQFKTKCIYEDHVQHHEGKMFTCRVCGRNFSGRKNLNRHLLLMHNDS